MFIDSSLTLLHAIIPASAKVKQNKFCTKKVKSFLFDGLSYFRYARKRKEHIMKSVLIYIQPELYIFTEESVEYIRERSMRSLSDNLHKSLARKHSSMPYKKDANGEKQEQARNVLVTKSIKSGTNRQQITTFAATMIFLIVKIPSPLARVKMKCTELSSQNGDSTRIFKSFR